MESHVRLRIPLQLIPAAGFVLFCNDLVVQYPQPAFMHELPVAPELDIVNCPALPLSALRMNAL